VHPWQPLFVTSRHAPPTARPLKRVSHRAPLRAAAPEGAADFFLPKNSAALRGPRRGRFRRRLRDEARGASSACSRFRSSEVTRHVVLGTRLRSIAGRSFRTVSRARPRARASESRGSRALRRPRRSRRVTRRARGPAAPRGDEPPRAAGGRRLGCPEAARAGRSAHHRGRRAAARRVPAEGRRRRDRAAGRRGERRRRARRRGARRGLESAPARALRRRRVGQRRRTGARAQQSRPRRGSRRAHRRGRGRGAGRPGAAGERRARGRARGAGAVARARSHARAARQLRRRQVHDRERPARRRPPGDRGGAREGFTRTAHDDAAGADRAARRRVAHRHAGHARALAVGGRIGARGRVPRRRGARRPLPVRRLPARAGARLRRARGRAGRRPDVRAAQELAQAPARAALARRQAGPAHPRRGCRPMEGDPPLDAPPSPRSGATDDSRNRNERSSVSQRRNLERSSARPIPNPFPLPPPDAPGVPSRHGREGVCWVHANEPHPAALQRRRVPS
jgi:hypothetical protein